MERTLLDVKQQNSEIGKIYYHRCPDNNKYFRSIRLSFNPWVNAITPQISNPIYGEPPEGLEEISTLRLQTLMKHQMSSMFCWSMELPRETKIEALTYDLKQLLALELNLLTMKKKIINELNLLEFKTTHINSHWEYARTLTLCRKYILRISQLVKEPPLGIEEVS